MERKKDFVPHVKSKPSAQNKNNKAVYVVKEVVFLVSHHLERSFCRFVGVVFTNTKRIFL